MNIKNHMFNFRFQPATGNVKKTAKYGHYHYQTHSFPIGSRNRKLNMCSYWSPEWTVSILKFWLISDHYFRKKWRFGVFGRKMVLMVHVSPFKGWIPGPNRCFQNNPRCLLHALTGFILRNSTLEKNYSS